MKSMTTITAISGGATSGEDQQLQQSELQSDRDNRRGRRHSPPMARREEDRFIHVGNVPQTPQQQHEDDDDDDDDDDEENGLHLRQAATSTKALLDPPVALADPYGWLRDDSRSRPDVLEHLQAENDYTQRATEHLETLRNELYEEFVSSIQETDYTLPTFYGKSSSVHLNHEDDQIRWVYYERTFQGKSYEVYCRAPKPTEPNSTTITSNTKPKYCEWDGSMTSPILPGEQVLLDVNVLAEEHPPYCMIGAVEPSPSHQLMAFTVDFTGAEKCQLFVQNVSDDSNNKNRVIVDHDETLEIYGSVEWGADDSTLFYMKMDDANRPFQLYRRRINGNNNNASGHDHDELLFQELDDTFWMGIYKSADGQYLFMEVSSVETTEVYFLKLSLHSDDNKEDMSCQLQCLAPRRPKVLYQVDHRNQEWWIQSNVGGLPNMALFKSPAVAHCQDLWQPVTTAALPLANSDNDKPQQQQPQQVFDGGYDRSLDNISCFRNHVVASGREGGLPRIWFLTVQDNHGDSDNINSDGGAVVTKFERLMFDEDAYDVELGPNFDYNTDTVIVVYDSLVTPAQWQEIDMNVDNNSRQQGQGKRILKERIVSGGSYDKTLFACERTTVMSRDGTTQIPVCLVYRKDVMEQHLVTGQPVYTHLYGASKIR
jgi:oligopeptidase B